MALLQPIPFKGSLSSCDFGGVGVGLDFANCRHDIGRSLQKRQEDSGPKFIDLRDFDFDAMNRFIFSPDLHSYWTASFVVSVVSRIFGILIATVAYNSALASSDGETRRYLEGLDFYFNSQNIVESLVFNVVFLAMFLVGRLAFCLFLYGPQATADGLRRNPISKGFESLLADGDQVGLVSWLQFVEGYPVPIGVVTAAAIYKIFFGESRGGKRKRREAPEYTNVEDEIAGNYRRILGSLSE